VVTGYEAERTENILKGLEITLVYNPRFEEGMTSTIQAGVAAAGQGTESKQEAQPRLAKVKQLLSPNKNVGGTGWGAEKQDGQGQKSGHK